jgi:hypothetical protein
MVILRPTAKLQRAIPLLAEPPGGSDTALGDWYVKPFKVDYQPLLLLVSSRSLLAILTPARHVATLPERLSEIVAARLRRLGVAPDVLEAETAAMAPVHPSPTRDRSVLGTLVDFAKSIPLFLPIRGWDETALPFLELRLGETPCRCAGRASEVIWPAEKAVSLLRARWTSAHAG